MSNETELTEQVASLLAELKGLRLKVKRLTAKTAEVPEEHVAVIAAAVAGYLGQDRSRSQFHYPPSPSWQANTRREQARY
jgi:hypothetical protein